MIPSSKCRPRNSAGRCLVKVSPYQICPRCLQQSRKWRFEKLAPALKEEERLALTGVTGLWDRGTPTIAGNGLKRKVTEFGLCTDNPSLVPLTPERLRPGLQRIGIGLRVCAYRL